jgi:hypothetical protein
LFRHNLSPNLSYGATKTEQAGFWFSRDPARGQGDHLHRWMEQARKTSEPN